MDKILKNKKVIVILGVIILLVSMGFVIFTIISKKEHVFEDDKINDNKIEEIKKEEVEEKKEITRVDVNSNSRPIAVMVNNIQYMHLEVQIEHFLQYLYY